MKKKCGVGVFPNFENLKAFHQAHTLKNENPNHPDHQNQKPARNFKTHRNHKTNNEQDPIDQWTEAEMKRSDTDAEGTRENSADDGRNSESHKRSGDR